MSSASPPSGMYPSLYVLLAVVSTQIGSALAKSLFAELHPLGVVFLRVSLAAGILLLGWRPRWRPATWQARYTILGFGLALVLMNTMFYLAIARIPLGVAVALEFIGPLGLAVYQSRQRLDLVWIALAALGVLLLAPLGQVWTAGTLDGWGVVFALLAAVGWATYIKMSAATGRRLPGIEGLAWAMAVGAGLLLPVGLMPGMVQLSASLFAIATGVALLSSALPYALELLALRHLPIKTFGVLLSLEPMVATLSGRWILNETISPKMLLAVVLISVAAGGAIAYQRPHRLSPGLSTPDQDSDDTIC